MMKLKDKTALITGGSDGMGLATAELFLSEGATVAIAGRSRERGEKALARLMKLGPVVFVQGDVSKPPDARRMVERTVRHFGRIDIVFNNAGVYLEKLAEDTTEKEWNRVVDINLKGTFLVCKYAIPYMRRQCSGVIINNSSDAGLIGNRSCPAYCASKGGVTIMTKALALDLAKDGIRVNCVNPGVIDTSMLEREVLASGNRKASDWQARPSRRGGARGAIPGQRRSSIRNRDRPLDRWRNNCSVSQFPPEPRFANALGEGQKMIYRRASVGWPRGVVCQAHQSTRF
jgi:NAD(P)-dependent dehydrogenase (short-subunit alcohol dehydrogenase family)